MPLEITPEANADLDRIFEFNAGWDLRWAEKVESRILERARSLSITPRIGRPTAEPDVRCLSLPDIQYVIYYEPVEDRIRILRIYSTKEIR